MQFPDLEMTRSYQCKHCGLILSSERWLLRHYKVVHEKMPKGTKLCNCDKETCPAPYSKRLVHADGQCIHTDGTHHKI